MCQKHFLAGLMALYAAIYCAHAHPMSSMMSSKGGMPSFFPPPMPFPMPEDGEAFPIPNCDEEEEEEQPSATDCVTTGLKNYISRSFNTLRFTTSMSYHDSQNFVTLFKEDGTERWTLYNFDEGRVYSYLNGACTYFYSSDAEITPTALVEAMAFTGIIDDFNGYNAFSYQANFTTVTIKGVINSLCVEALTYISVNSQIATLAVHYGFLTGEQVEQTITDEISEAQAYIDTALAQGGCRQVYSIDVI